MTNHRARQSDIEIRDAEIARLRVENAELGTRFDALSATVDGRMTALEAENERLRSALEELDTKLEIESIFEESGQMFVAFYRVPAGPWHKILGLIR